MEGRAGRSNGFNQDQVTTYERRRTRKKRKRFIFYQKNNLMFWNLCNRTKSTEIVVTRSNNENINSKLLPYRKKFSIPDHLNDMVTKCKLENKQSAIAFLKKKDGSFDIFGPYYPKKSNGRMIHSEQQIFKQIKLKLKQKKMKDYCKLFAYSKKSPCLGREGKRITCKKLPLIRKIYNRNTLFKKFCIKRKICIDKRYAKKHKVPCMYELDHLSFILGHFYGIKVYNGFSEFYGCTGPITKVIKKHKNNQNTKLGQELQIAKTRIRNVFDVQFCFPKNVVSTFRSKIFNQVKENILPNKRREVLNAVSKILRETMCVIPDTPHTFVEWEQTGKERAKQLHEKITAVMMELLNEPCKSVCDLYKEEFEKTFHKTLNESSENCCNDILNEHINKMSVLLHIKDIQAFKYHPEFIYIQ